MDKSLFFAVWSLPELRNLIKSFMYPHKRTANYYDYYDGDSAVFHGYKGLIFEKRLMFGPDAMAMAAQTGNIDILEYLYKEKIDLYSTVAIDHAVNGSQYEAFIWLINHGFVPNVAGWLYPIAAQTGCKGILLWLFEYNQPEDFNLSMVYNILAQKNHFELLKICWDLFPWFRSVDLFFALESGNLEMAKWIHANSTQQAQVGFYVDNAVKSGNLDMVKWVIETFDNPAYKSPISIAASVGNIDILNYLHNKSIHGDYSNAGTYAAAKGHLPVLKWLRKHLQLWVPLKAFAVAIKKGHAHVAGWIHGHYPLILNNQYFYYRGPQVVATIEWLYVKSGSPPVLAKAFIKNSAELGHLDVLKWIVSKNYCIQQQLSTLAALAAKGGHINVIEWLHELHGPIHNSAIMEAAAQHGHLNLVKWLYNRGYPHGGVETMDSALSNGMYSSFKWLCDRTHINPSIEGLNGAVCGGYLDIVKWIIGSTNLFPDEDTISNIKSRNNSLAVFFRDLVD
jgi:hypothetical protein